MVIGEICWEERGGYRYWIVQGPDGETHGFWDEGVARALAEKFEEDEHERQRAELDDPPPLYAWGLR
jgi:hypothetical protein